MKRFLLFLSVLMCAMGVSISTYARWDMGSQLAASEIVPGKMIVFEYACNRSNEGRWFTNTQIADAAGLLVDEAVWVVEEGPKDMRTGAPTVFLRNYASGKYIGKKDGLKLVDITEAANFQVMDYSVEIPWSTGYAWDKYQYGVIREELQGTATEWIGNWYRTQGQELLNDKTVGFAYSLGEDITKSDNVTWLNGYGKGCFANYMDCINWNAYEIKYVNDKAGDLTTLINQYIEEGEYTEGAGPGFYTAEAAEAYNAALENALQVSITGTTDEEFDNAIQSLKDAHAAVLASSIPITEGYYYMVNAGPEFLNSMELEVAAYPDITKGKMMWDVFNPEDPKFIYKFTKADDEDEWNLQNFGTDYWVGGQGNWYNSATAVTESLEEAQNIRKHNWPGMFFWGSHSNHQTSLYVNSTSTQGTLNTWGAWGDNLPSLGYRNLWYVRPVPAETIEKLKPIKEQTARNNELRALAAEANTVWGKLFVLDKTDEALLTKASGGVAEEPEEGNQILFSAIRKQGIETSDKYEFLIDGDNVTYMQGTGFIQAALGETPQRYITFMYDKRMGTEAQQGWGQNERPGRSAIYATNDTVNGGEWTYIADVDMSQMDCPAYQSLDLGAEYKYIRYDVLTNNTGGTYFTLSEFQIYKAEINKETSQYYSSEELTTAADNMMAVRAQKLTVENATLEDIAELRAAIDGVKALYADTTDLAVLINQCEQILAGAEVGEDMGQVSDQALIDNLQQAINDAKQNAFVTPLSVEAIRTATANINAAKDAFMAGMKTIEPGKWYFIVNKDQYRTGEQGTDDAACYGNAIYFANKYYDNKSITKWGYYNQLDQRLNADNNPKAMWRFVPVAGSNDYAIQNMYNGHYLGDFAGENINLPASAEPVPYSIVYNGKGMFTLTPNTKANKNQRALFAEGAANDVVCHEAITGTASSWSFIEIDPEEQEAIVITDFAQNLIDIMAVPYNVSSLADYNDDVHTYAIKKITQEENEAGELVSTIEFYEKNDIAAGEPCLIALGAWDDPDMPCEESNGLLIPFPTDIIDPAYNMTFNGIVGGLKSTSVGGGVAISGGKSFAVVGEKGSGFDAQTGVIDPATYKGEVTGVETALTFTFTGLNPIPSVTKGDVNGDGVINAADVVSIYNYIISGEESGISAAQADVNNDQTVNAADVVSVYNIIIDGDSAASKRRRK